MELREKIQICMMCNNCKRDHRGVVCGLTDEKPTFETECENFVENPVEAEKVSHKAYQWQKDDGVRAIKGTALFLVVAIMACAAIPSWFFLGMLALMVDESLMTELVVMLSTLALNAVVYFYIWHRVRRKRSLVAYISGALSYLVATLFGLPAVFQLDPSVEMLSFNIGMVAGLIASIVFSVIFITTVIKEKMFKMAERPAKADIVAIVLCGISVLAQIIGLILI